jgi:hypothetical protein
MAWEEVEHACGHRHQRWIDGKGKKRENLLTWYSKKLCRTCFANDARAKRDLGGLFNWIPDERVYFQFGYLNSKVMTGSGGHEYGYAGFAANANYVVGLGVTGLNNLLDANFKTPALLDRVLATVGVLAAKRMNDEFWTLKEGWDYGLSIDVLKLVTGK